MTTPISTLADHTQQRLEEPVGAGAWWSRQFEVYSAIMEAQSDLLLLVGRPTQVVNVPFTLAPNTVWQAIPKGYLAITDIQGAGSPLYKINLYDLDFLQTSWGSNWQQDTDAVAQRWAPIGFNMFVVHPAPAYPQTVNVTAIQYPATDTWPYSGSEAVQFSDEFFVALELYATHYATIKELGAEFQNGLRLFDQYMQLAKRMTGLQDLRDPLIFTSGFGASSNTNPTTKR